MFRGGGGVIDNSRKQAGAAVDQRAVGERLERLTDQWFKTRAAAAMQEFLDAGYTTLMEGGGQVPAIIQLKEKVEKGELTGPRIITSGRADPANVKTEAAARAQVQLLAKGGSRS